MTGIVRSSMRLRPTSEKGAIGLECLSFGRGIIGLLTGEMDRPTIFKVTAVVMGVSEKMDTPGLWAINAEMLGASLAMTGLTTLR